MLYSKTTQFTLTKKLKKAGYKHKLQRRTNDRFCDGTSSGDFNGKFYDGTNNNDSSTAKLYLEQKKEHQATNSDNSNGDSNDNSEDLQ
ncbi:hypothetical protein C2G38_2193712 [Gigaspora rosea]|uniref:Uncharacterized protein n=1 Tax=Gigaspora rosea TaxID=44941 RepID=A0A397UXH5_9GLOM|nr:hypothetical protein C2G38_2193712 [Gigaspora rosea]